MPSLRLGTGGVPGAGGPRDETHVQASNIGLSRSGPRLSIVIGPPHKLTDLVLSDRPHRVDRPHRLSDRPHRVDRPHRLSDRPHRVSDRPHGVIDRPHGVIDRPHQNFV